LVGNKGDKGWRAISDAPGSVERRKIRKQELVPPVFVAVQITDAPAPADEGHVS